MYEVNWGLSQDYSLYSVDFYRVLTTAADVIVRVVENTASGNPESADDNNGRGVISIPRRFVNNGNLMWHVAIHELMHTVGFQDSYSCGSQDSAMFHTISENGPFPGVTCADLNKTKKVWGSDESPIMISASCNQIELSDAWGGVFFDISARGVRDLVAWPENPSDVGFLVYDRNGNGQVDDGRELFGNRTPLQSGAVADHGYQALMEFDQGSDGWVDGSDSAYSHLRFWLDGNRDGVSESSELFSLDSAGITGLSTEYRYSGRVDRYGNAFRYTARISSDNCEGQRGRSWDAFLVNIRQ